MVPRSNAGTALLALGLVLGSGDIAGQENGDPEERASAVLVGSVVSTSTGRPVDGAVVHLLGSGFGAVTDSLGEFRIPQTWAGPDSIEVRFIGYEPGRQPIDLVANETTRVTLLLSQTVIRIADLTVEIRQTRRARNLQGFAYRMERGFGTFFTPLEIQRRNPRLPSDLLRGMANVSVGPVQYGKAEVLIGKGTNLMCPPAVFLDGMYQSGLDLDDIPREDLGAVEVYRRESETPIDFLRPGSTCGAIVIWTPDGAGFLDWAAELPDPY
ncbi:MAG: carboxypeptidase-like regulatory domain-containing protein [Gemmatimonadetes bacterium]|nr:carboxypeptidase-like regulatory domain-containing protein [Gemmatimonadota bacterium]